jgi:hypothetical protein
MLKIIFSRFIILFLTCLIFTSCDNQKNNSSASNTSAKTSFNTTDKSITSNGNLALAMEKINQMDMNQVWNDAQPTTAEVLTKSPYSAIGKLYKIKGQLYKIEELPPNNNKGRWSEMLLLTDNPNSPLGVTTIDFIYNGDVSKIKSGQIITCAGFFIGTFDSANAMGGKVEAVTMIGNNAR